MNTCQKCGYEWKARISNPKCCPNCCSRKWNKIIDQPREDMASLSEAVKCGA